MAGIDDVEGEAAAGRVDLWEPVILAEPVVGESALPSLTGATDAVADDTPSSDKRWGRLRWLFTRRLCFGGLAGALVLFCLSMGPSLVPRTWVLQGVVSGVSAAIGYGLGSAMSAGIRSLIPREPSPRAKRIGWWVLGGATVVLGGLSLNRGAEWQKDVRQLMEMEHLEVYEWGAILFVTAVIAGILIVISRLVRGGSRVLIRLLERVVPPRVAVAAGVTIAALLLAGFIQGVLFEGMVSAVNSSYSLTDKGTSPWISQPVSELRSGGSGSQVDWGSLGEKGRDFTGTGGGPTAADIEAFTGEAATEPVRVYVGLRSADSLEERIDLAMGELDRTGAFERSVVAVMTTTGTGWIDENVADSLEFLHGGDTAEVGMQYSYLPSWVSFLVDRSKASDTGRDLIAAVSDRIAQMPEDERPTLLVFGESLGSYGTESAFEGLDDMLDRTDGALLVGPTFTNPLHGDFTDARDQGSPFWRPVLEEGKSVRFAVDPDDLVDESLYPSGSEWTPPRVVYLQNSSDPITYFNPELLWRSPDWLDGERGPDVRDDMVWIPVITFWQVAADMAFSMAVPAGHGHRYGSNVVDGWVELSAPQGWTDNDTLALRSHIDHRADQRDAKKDAAS